LLNWTIDFSSIDWGDWSFNPENGYGLTPEEGKITIQVSVLTPNQQNSEFEGFIRVENINNSEDFDLIPVHLVTPVKIQSINRPIMEFFYNFIYFFSEKILTLLSIK